MRTINYTEAPNGARYLSPEGKQMDIVEEISKENFKEKISGNFYIWIRAQFACVPRKWCNSH